jgi:glycine cleavage system H protein
MTLDPKTLKYTSTHEWSHLEDGGKIATVGLSDFAIHALTDLVHVDLPPPGRGVQAGKPFGEVESVKAVSDLYSPVDGEILEANTGVAEDLDALTNDPYGAGWLVKIRVREGGAKTDVMDLDSYRKQCEEAQ